MRSQDIGHECDKSARLYERGEFLLDLSDWQRHQVLAVLDQHDGNLRLAARELGFSRKATLRRLMRNLEIDC